MRIPDQISQFRIENGRVYCLPDVRAVDLKLAQQQQNHFFTPSPASSDSVSYSSKGGHDDNELPVASVISFYGQKKQNNDQKVSRAVSPVPGHTGAPTAIGVSGTSASQVRAAESPPESFFSDLDSSDDEYEDMDQSPAKFESSRYYESLAAARSLLTNSRTDYMNTLRETLHRVAADHEVDLSSDALREELRKRERQEIDTEVQQLRQEEQLRNMGFGSSSCPLLTDPHLMMDFVNDDHNL